MKTQIIIKTSSGLKKAEVSFSQFPDGDTHCQITSVDSVAGNDIFIWHDLYPDQNNKIFQLLLLLDVLNDLGAKSISLFVPYLPYSRQDKRHDAGEAISAQTLCKTLSGSGVSALYTCDCHFMRGLASIDYVGLEIHNLSLYKKLIESFENKFKINDYDLVSPDLGASYMVKGHGGLSMRKQRGDYQNEIDSRHRPIREIRHDHLKLNSEIIVLIDDMISTGGTMLGAIDNLKKEGKKVYCLAVHGLFLKDCYEKLIEQTEGVLVSDTLDCRSSVKLVQKAWEDEILPAWSNNQRQPNA